jgi:hypothetical protein
MPNYKLGSHDSTEYAKRQIAALCELHNAMFESDFPLSADEVAAAIAPARVRHLLQELRQMGADSVRNTRQISAIVEDEAIPRAAAVRFNLTQPMLYCFEAQAYGYHAFKSYPADRTPFDLGALSEESRERLITWVNKAVWERRRTKLTRRTVMVFLDHHCDSNYMLHARWPALTMLFKGHPQWEPRMRERPRNLNRWRWQGEALEWQIKNFKAMQVAEQMLIGASLITAKLETLMTAPVRCEIVDWKTINNEYL